EGRASTNIAPPKPRPVPASPPTVQRIAAANTLDSTWDRRLAQGLVRPEMVIDLHDHRLAAAHTLLDIRLQEAIAKEARVILLITGKPPRADRWLVGRGAIRATIGHWLQASRHAASIAAVRAAHPRHGGAGALYLILRRRRTTKVQS